MKVYTGHRVNDGTGGQPVTVIDGSRVEALQERQDLVNHSPDGFNWGYGGSGPAQLALAILADLFGDKIATSYYQRFKWDVISKLPVDWQLKETFIRNWMQVQYLKEELKII